MVRHALIEFSNLCTRYESRPTQNVFEYIYDIVTDSEMDTTARICGLKSLKRHHRKEMCQLGITMIREEIRELNAEIIQCLLITSLQGADDKIGLTRELLREVFRRVSGTDAYDILEKCCRKRYDHIPPMGTHKVWETMLYQLGIHVVPGPKKLDVAYRSYQLRALTVECCQHLLQHQVAIGEHLWDFFHDLAEPEFIRFRLMGEHFIAGGDNPERENQFIGSQSVHKLDKYRTSFLEWLCEQTFVRENEKQRYQVDQLLEVYYKKNMSTIVHIKGLSACFEFLKYTLVHEYQNGNLVEDKVPELVRWSLMDTLRRMIYFVSKHKYRIELQKRLIEELEEMNGTCVSGHLNRIFNCLMGFEDILNNNIEEEYRHLLRKYLDEGGSKNEELLDAIVMAEWSEGMKKECIEIGSRARKRVQDELPDSIKEEKENEWYTDVLYKWSGLKINE